MKLAKLFDEERKRRGLSYREASREIGLSHTTLVQLKDDKPMDFNTAIAVCKWLGVPITAVAELDENDQAMNAIATILKTAPELKAVFIEASREVDKGNLSLSDFQQIVDFAAFIISKRREEGKRGGSRNPVSNTENRDEPAR